MVTLLFQKGNIKGADQAARMHTLICTFVVRKQQSQGFLCRGPYDVEAQNSWPPPGYTPVMYGIVQLTILETKIIFSVVLICLTH